MSYTNTCINWLIQILFVFPRKYIPKVINILFLCLLERDIFCQNDVIRGLFLCWGCLLRKTDGRDISASRSQIQPHIEPLNFLDSEEALRSTACEKKCSRRSWLKGTSILAKALSCHRTKPLATVQTGNRP